MVRFESLNLGNLLDASSILLEGDFIMIAVQDHVFDQLKLHLDVKPFVVEQVIQGETQVLWLAEAEKF